MGKCYRQNDCRNMEIPLASDCAPGYAPVGFDARKCNWDEKVRLLLQKENEEPRPLARNPIFLNWSPPRPYLQFQLHPPSLTFSCPRNRITPTASVYAAPRRRSRSTVCGEAARPVVMGNAIPAKSRYLTPAVVGRASAAKMRMTQRRAPRVTRCFAARAPALHP